MTKLLLKIIALSLIVVFVMTLGGLLFILKKDSVSSYAAAIIDKHKRLLVSESPRIIFVGGSNLAFGLNSRLLEKYLGKHVVNMGLQIGLGLRYQLSEVKDYIRENDVIIIIPEYEQFFGENYFNGDWSLAFCILNFPETRKYLDSLKQYEVILKNYSFMLRTKIFALLFKQLMNKTPLAYADFPRQAFNEHGDLEGHLNEESVSTQIKSFELKGFLNQDAVRVLNYFKAHVDKLNARVYFIYPSLIDVQYKRNEEKINSLHSLLKNELKIPLLSVPSDYVFNQDLFYDAVYHLNSRGRNLRTLMIIDDLKKTAVFGDKSGNFRAK